MGDHAASDAWYLRVASAGLTVAAYAAWADVVRRACADRAVADQAVADRARPAGAAT